MAVSSGKCPSADMDWFLNHSWEPPIEDWSQLILDDEMDVGEDYEEIEDGDI